MQCLIQRDFSYATQDIRNAYLEVKKALSQPAVKKVVFIMHSQGGIEGSLILDWLFADIPGKLTRKLEVFTFGNAANHFNNPEHAPDGSTKSKANGHGKHPERRAIRHIEHYANNQEFVSRWGVLSFASSPGAASNRFCGRVFEQNTRGHQFNQHYLDTMFPLDDETGFGLSDQNSFMDSEIQVAEYDDISAPSPKANNGSSSKQAASVRKKKVIVRNLTFPPDQWSLLSPVVRPTTQRVGQLSRLWMYRNGLTPPS